MNRRPSDVMRAYLDGIFLIELKRSLIGGEERLEGPCFKANNEDVENSKISFHGGDKN